MSDPKIIEFSPDQEVQSSGLWNDLSQSTQTLDLSNLFSKDLTLSGSFDVRGVQSTSLAKLLEAIPIPALLVSQSHAVIFANEASGKIVPYDEGVVLVHLSQVFRYQRDAALARELVDKVFLDRKHLVREAVLGTEKDRFWCKIHFRSLRMGGERHVLVLIEDLTAEKEQVILAKKYSKKLKDAHDQLEVKVGERTYELASANKHLQYEIDVRKRAQERLDLAANVIASSNEAILITDPQAKIVEVNDAFCEITGYSKQEVMGKNPSVMASGRHDKAFWKRFWEAVVRNGKWKGEVWDRRKTGELFPKLLSVSTLARKSGEVTHYVGIFSDITRQKLTEARLERLAHYDPLTKLPNRALFRDRLNRAIIRAERNSMSVALIFLDLDGFKLINDTLGHQIGDSLLDHVAERLSGSVRKSDTVARLGGDEFTLVIADFTDPSVITPLARKILELLRKPFNIEGHRILVSASMGVAFYPEDASGVDELLQHADTAMYYVKDRGKNGFQYFSRKMNEEVSDRLNMETSLRDALRMHQFQVYFQPQFDIASGKMVGSEALIRWKHPKLGMVPPDKFIPLAEAIGLIGPIGNWVLSTACHQLKGWLHEDKPQFRVAVNISGYQLEGDTLLKNVSRILDETGLDPGLLELEVTESVLIGDAEGALQKLKDLKDLGILLAIDDFGTGYSSLYHLKRFPIDKLKIDKSFVGDIGGDKDNESIIRTIIAIGHSLRLKVIAEGVETKAQLDFLRQNGCDEVQGYYYGKPVPAGDFARRLFP
jgi:diguanylate cyclase (GGDEF)-like protein/PAS domain S-box-containing protein